ncbi:MAG: formylglycine-generating enzyme family protein [Candidatus Alcyoniella australis]|nr:formylglycine-generating enzyme family protein [Candidatus Alcyoniella australis]
MKRALVYLILAAVAALGFQQATLAQSSQAKTMTNSIGMKFVLVPSGSFTMGCNKNFENCFGNDPQHRVTISKPFYLGTYEVTQEQWVAVMGSNPSEFKGRDRPVEKVSWNDAKEFIRRLNAKEGTSAYRLPTEAEWEYAARAGSTGKYCFGDDEGALSQYAWYDKSYDSCKSSGCTNPVGKLRPNSWGLYDMHGNVWEWVSDWYGERYYSSSPSSDPRGPSSGTYRVVRGGCWGDGFGRYLRASYRYYGAPTNRGGPLGFRCARD